MRLIERRVHSDLLVDLAEDLATRWVPDVLADVDLGEAVLDPRVAKEDVRLTDVPRVGGGVRRAPVLSGSALSALRSAVQPLREVSDEVLDPAVCGYRLGATGDVSYSEEYRRFRAFAEALSEQSSWVVVADVSNFFDSVSPHAVRLALRSDFESAIEPMVDLLLQFRRRGVAGLPAGYGDARLIANAVLAPVDRALGVPFTRWIDDYRIFTSTRAEADRVVQSLRNALGQLDMRLNDAKLEIMPTLEYRRTRHGVPLDSVYHPQDEPENAVSAALRSVFISAVSTGDRRRLRFVLPRLARELDPSAIDYAFAALHANSIDAPRLVHYLSAFASDDAVAARIRALASEPALSDWVLMRIVPLLCRIDLDEGAFSAIRKRATTTDSSLLWGLLIRTLAVHHHAPTLNFLTRPEGVQDSRAAAAALMDLGSEVPGWMRTAASEATIRALERRAGDGSGGAPLPKVESLL
ncbi:RNA-directed DNA polymerase [Nocardioides sp. SOB77]|uniref:RNA-directed DNA polymerase n=1 Tax=Nocardioides oceani TaxID=3058369 RepID=A0ABT8FA26_9ACTN|nr:RNA-directed DNA polymerase [Nocardioides oceani]MDN4171320.1 RNA-directed DNA polymerase [Nocardioides oceani]